MFVNESCDSFRELIESGAYYVDKSDMLKEYLQDNFKKVVLFARPRRFGKTLTMTMFRDFLDIRQDSRKLFEGLKVMDCPEFTDEYMNQYPVIYCSFKEITGDSTEQVFQNFQILFSKLCEDFLILQSSDRVSEASRFFYNQLLMQQANQPGTLQALDLLCRMLRQHFEKPVFVIIDEYDVPMAKTLGTPAYDKTREMVEQILSYVCKTNENVKAVILSGCLYTVKNSTYTGVNNLIPYTVLSTNFASYIGFTDADVRQLLADAGIPDRYAVVSEWYDGYLFGKKKMYCPWDVLRYVSSVLDGSYSDAMGPESYWVNTSEITQNIIHGFLGRVPGVMESFERLLAGKTIDCPVNDTIPYHRIHENGENLWSALLETGYLTKAVYERMPLMPLRIPNRGIQDVFRQEVWGYFRDKVDNSFVRNLADALWSGDGVSAERALNQILEATLSFYHEYHEYSYHLILDGFFTGLGYRVLSETETGYGRSDLLVLDPARSRCLILELKHAKKQELLEGGVEEAISQITENKYASRTVYEGYAIRLGYGMAFYNKRCRIEKAEESRQKHITVFPDQK